MTQEQDEKEFEEWWRGKHPLFMKDISWTDRDKADALEIWLASLRSMREEQNKSLDFLDDEKEDIYKESDGTKLESSLPMDEKIKEIEEQLEDELYCIERDWIDNIRYLLSHIIQLEAQLIDWKKSWKLEMAHSTQCERRIKELEKETKMDEIKEIEEEWRENYGMPIANGDIDKLFSHITQLEAQLKKGTCCNLLCQAEKLQFERRIEELEERIKLAEVTRNDALAYAKGYKSELFKWIAPHEDSELQEMKEQSQQPSLSAKQAYINALQWTIKHREAKVKELEEGIEKHKETKLLLRKATQKENMEWIYLSEQDEELYKLVEGK